MENDFVNAKRKVLQCIEPETAKGMQNVARNDGNITVKRKLSRTIL